MQPSRRQFLATTAAATAAASVFTPTALAADSKRQFTLDLRPGSIGVKANQVEAIRLAAKHGFESVAAAPKELAKLSDAENESLLGTLEQAGLVWGSSGLPVDFRKDKLTYRNGLNDLPKMAKALQRAGVTRMGTWLMPGHDELTYLENFKQHTERLREVAKILADHGIRFGLEYVGTPSLRYAMRFPFVHTMRETAELHDAIGTDNMGFILDAWHWHTAGESADDIRELQGRQVVGCDLNDAPKGLKIDQLKDNERELPATTGVIDVKSFLTALVDIGYDGPVRAEPFNQTLNQMDNDSACETTSEALHRACKVAGL